MERSAPKRIELGVGAGLSRLPRGKTLIGKPEIIFFAPGSASGPPPQTGPAFLFGKRGRDRDRGRRFGSCRVRQFVHPLHDFRGQAVFIHPIHEKTKVAGIASCDGFHFFQKRAEFFCVQFPIKIQAEQIIAKADFGRHLQLLGKSIRSLDIVAINRIVQQCAQCSGSKLRNLSKVLEIVARLSAFFRIRRMDLERREIKFVKIVPGIFV